MTNRARAILVVNATGAPDVWEFIAAKRGQRIGWRDVFGARISRRHFAHSKTDGAMFWTDADEGEVTNAQAAKAGKKDIEGILLSLVRLQAVSEISILRLVGS